MSLTPQQELFEHFAGIKREAISIGIDMVARRELLDRYFALNAETTTTTCELAEVSLPRSTCYWVVPENTDPARRMLYIHGGSWVSGSIRGYQAFVEKLAVATGSAVLFVDYSLAPEAPFPAGLEDCVEALQWLQANGPDGESEAGKCFIAGDSAGGNLTLSTLLACKTRGLKLPDAALAMSPCTDLTASGESMQTHQEQDPILVAEAIPILAQVYVQQKTEIADPLVSPLFGDLTGLPPVMLQVGEAEVLLDDSTRFAEKLEAAGGETELETWPGMPHVFQGFAPYLPEANQAIESIARFFQRF